MESHYADRPCPDCQTIIPGIEKKCQNCTLRVGRVSRRPFTGSYVDWVKR